jgi:hypothetical protein
LKKNNIKPFSQLQKRLALLFCCFQQYADGTLHKSQEWPKIILFSTLKKEQCFLSVLRDYYRNKNWDSALACNKMQLKTLSIGLVFFSFMQIALCGICYEDLREKIVDPQDISMEEYRQIQERFALVSESELPPMITNRCLFFFKSFKFVGDSFAESPVFKIVHLNNSSDKKNCVVLYASYNSPYPENVLRIISALEEKGFDGHVIYRIGGYPNLKNGSLKTIHVPYAFKICALQEAYLLGYQNLLWIDCSMIPIRDLKPLFEIIETRGYFAITSGSTIKAEVDNGRINQQALSAMKIPYSSASLAPHITTPLFGLNTHSHVGQEILRSLGEMAEEGSAFFCEWVDEAPISAVLYHMELKPVGIWHQFMIKDNESDGSFDDTHYFSMSCKRPNGREQ